MTVHPTVNAWLWAWREERSFSSPENPKLKMNLTNSNLKFRTKLHNGLKKTKIINLRIMISISTEESLRLLKHSTLNSRDFKLKSLDFWTPISRSFNTKSKFVYLFRALL